MRKRKDIRAHKKAKHTREKTISVKTITGNILLCLIIIAMFLSILPNIKGIYTYFTDKRTVENTCTVEYHTLTYNYYIVSGSGNISQMQRTETRKGYTGTTIVLGADESLMVSDEDNAYYKMDFEIAGQKYEKDSEYIMPANDVTIEQYYYLTKYTITFDTNSLVDPIPERGISDGETFGELPELSKTGYTFSGWYKENTFENQVTSSTVFAESTDITLYAKLDMDTYNIDYTLNNGTVETANPETYDIETESFTLNNPSKTGYTFNGWSGTGLTGDTNKAVTIAQGSTGDRSYTANYTANTYYVQFNVNSGSGSMSNQTMTYDTASNLTANKFTKTGYEFTGWNTASDGSGTSYADGEEVSNLTATNSATVILYAQWSTDTYNIDYTLNNGTVETANPETYNAETESFTLNNPSKTGYTFKGWSGTGLTGDKNKTVTITKGSTGDRSYTANYTANTYYVQFNKNSGVGTMSNQTMTYDTASNLTANKFIRIGYEFAGWNTASDGSGTSYADGEEVSNLTATNSAAVILYAQWEIIPIKYAVQIYGINQDVDAYGNAAGLTFGPAVGANYNNSYVTHEYEEITENPGNYYVKIITHTVAANGSETTSSEYLKNSSGNNVTRTAAQVTARENINLHEMTWTQIQAVPDKTVFEDCMLCGDTKSVRLTLNSTIASGSAYNQYGDGAGMLYNTINNTTGAYYRNWNPSQSQNAYVGTDVTLVSDEKSYGSNARNAGGYSVSHIRATLIGKNAKTNEGYAGDVNLTSDTCLYSCIESDLQAVITPKRVKYVTGTSTSSYSLNDDIADSIWLFSDREMYSTGENSGNTTEGLGTSGDGYNKFGDTESKYYTSSYSTSGNTKRVGYTEAGLTNEWWLRSPDLMSSPCYSRRVRDSGVINSNVARYGYGLAFGFCIQ